MPNQIAKKSKTSKVCYLCQHYWNFQWYTVEKYFYNSPQKLHEGERCDFCDMKFSYIDKSTPFGYYIDYDMDGGFMIEFKVGPFCLKCVRDENFIKQCTRKKFYIDINTNNNIKLQCLHCNSFSLHSLESIALDELICNKKINNEKISRKLQDKINQFKKNGAVTQF